MIALENRNRIEEIASNKDLSFYILTIEDLGGKSPDEFASNVFTAWGLKENEILLLLSASDRRIEMNFNNPALLSRLQHLPNDYDNDGDLNESKVDEFVSKHFIPYAKEGEFSLGILELIETTQNLYGVKKNDAAAPTSNNSGDSIAEQDNPQRFIEQTLLILLFGLLTIFLIASMFILTTSRISEKKKLKKLSMLVQEVIRETRGAQESLKTISSQYRTLDFTTISKELNNRIVECSILANELLKVRTPFIFSKKGYRETLKEKETQLSNIRKKLMNQIDDLKKIESSISEIQDISEQARLKMESIKAGLESLGLIPQLEQLKERLADLENQYYQILALESLEIIEELQKVRRSAEELDRRLKMIPNLADQLSSAPQRIKNFKEQVRRLINENSLKLNEFDPNQHIHAAERTYFLFKQSYEAGDFDKAEQLSKEIASSLRESINVITERIALKRKVQDDLSRGQRMLSSILSFDQNKLEVEIQKLKDNFVERLWVHMPEQYKENMQALVQIQQKIAAICELASDSVQKYVQANELLKMTLNELSNIENVIDNIRNAHHKYTLRFKEAQRQFGLWNVRFQDAMKKAQMKEIKIYTKSSAAQILDRCRSQKETTVHLMKIKPNDLAQLELSVSLFKESVRSLEEGIEQLVEQKQMIENRLQKMQQSYRGSSRGTNNVQYHSSSYVSTVDRINQLLLIGAYADALNLLGDAERSIRFAESHSTSYGGSGYLSNHYNDDDNQRNHSSGSYYDNSTTSNYSSGSYDSGNSDSGGSSGGDNW
jgi:uncharacterized membrane protein YgcG